MRSIRGYRYVTSGAMRFFDCLLRMRTRAERFSVSLHLPLTSHSTVIVLVYGLWIALEIVRFLATNLQQLLERVFE
jgi:hypothetical protein